jgi:hypothetical protein
MLGKVFDGPGCALNDPPDQVHILLGGTQALLRKDEG